MNCIFAFNIICTHCGRMMYTEDGQTYSCDGSHPYMPHEPINLTYADVLRELRRQMAMGQEITECLTGVNNRRVGRTLPQEPRPSVAEEK